ncbi:hypothetical protein BU23DRAFT_660119, partial [Bimuria novae-zelandiae CBS 107.79]
LPICSSHIPKPHLFSIEKKYLQASSFIIIGLLPAENTSIMTEPSVNPAETAATPPSDYLKESSPEYDDLPLEPLHEQPTRLAVHPYLGLWFCPNCTPAENIPDDEYWFLLTRGYFSGRVAYNAMQGYEVPPPIPKCYKNFTNRLWFTNPLCVTRCQNQWSEGYRGIPCTFDRSGLDIPRNPENEKRWDKVAGRWKWHCYLCAHPKPGKRYGNKYPKLTDYLMESLAKNEIMEVGKVKNKFEPTKRDWLFRINRYDGTEESLKCRTSKFGKREHPDSEHTRCPGVYGGEIYRGIFKKEPGGGRWIVENFRPRRRPVLTKEDILNGVSTDWTEEETNTIKGQTVPEFSSSSEESD